MPSYYDESTKTWYCKFYYTDYTGAKKQKKKRGFKLQREAREWERAFLERLQGTPDMTFQALYDLYIEDMSHRIRQSTLDNTKCVFNTHILPYFKNKPINSITPTDIRTWQNSQIDSGASDAYLRDIHKKISAIMNYAVTYYNLPSNPCHKAGTMGKIVHSLNFWTLEQYNSFIQYVSDIRIHAAFQVLFYSGMRCGEMLALTLADFDFKANTINVSKTLYRNCTGAPKTDNSNRAITMPPAIMVEIKEYANKIYGIQPQDRVFAFSKESLRRNMIRYCELSGVPRVRIHDIRHSHVSLLIDMGFSPHLIAERIGDTVEMVNKVYGHLYPNKQNEVANRLNQLIVPN